MGLIDLAGAAAEVGCTERWLANQLRAGKFPAHKIGRRWMFTDDDIVAILKICSVTPAGFPVKDAFCAGEASSMTKTTLRRLRQDKQPR